MMYVEDRVHEVYEWHVGEPIPELKSRVITFNVDGDELDLILEAMRKTRPHQ